MEACRIPLCPRTSLTGNGGASMGKLRLGRARIRARAEPLPVQAKGSPGIAIVRDALC